MVLSQLATFVAVYLFSADYRKASSSLAASTLWRVVGSLEAIFILFFLLFVVLIRKEYIRTFFTTSSGKQFNVYKYRQAKSDQSKIEVFGSHKSYYSSIREELTEWVHENWEDWNDEGAEWFTERVKASVPEEMRPANRKREE